MKTLLPLFCSLALCACEARVSESNVLGVTVSVPGFGSGDDARRLAEVECAKRKLRAAFRSAYRRRYVFECNASGQ